MTGITNRLILTRLGYHLALGVLSIRDPRDGIEITDEIIENNIPIRLFRPLNRKYDSANGSHMQPTIIFYHGGKKIY